MDSKEIKLLCSQKRTELMNKYFDKLIYEAAHVMPEEVDESRYSLNLPSQVVKEYYDFLKEILAGHAPEKNLDEILDKRHLAVKFTENDKAQLEEVYHDAKVITLWEKINNSNHEDVTYYKGLLKEYTEDLLRLMEADFIEDVEKL